MANEDPEETDDTTLTLRCPSELVSKATYAAMPEDTGVFAMFLGPLPEDTIVALERAAQQKAPVLLSFNERPVLIDQLLTLERKNPQTVHLVGQIGDTAAPRSKVKKG